MQENKTFGFQWHLTDMCNGRCAHCYQESFIRGKELTPAAQKILADKIFDSLSHRLISVNITGGEPMLLDHLPDLMEHIAIKPNLDELWIITNGSIANKRLLHRLGSICPMTGFKVSMEAADVKINDSIRWPGHLDSLNRNIDDFLAWNKQVVLMVTLGKHNVDQVRSIVSWARKKACSGVMFERFIPLGTGLTMMHQTLDTQQWLNACKNIGDEAQQVIGPYEASVYKAFWISFNSEKKELLGASCNLGDESMALMPDSTVFPCRRLPIPIGKAITTSFDEILRKLNEFSIEKIRPRLTGATCKACKVAQCAGCRAAAMALIGDFLADDPLCPSPNSV